MEYLDLDDNNAAIKRMLRQGERRLIVNLDHLRDYKRDLADGCVAGLQSIILRVYTDCLPLYSLLRRPLDYLPAFDHALKEVVVSVQDPTRDGNLSDTAFFVGLRGSFGDHHVNPRTLRAAMLGKMISIEGIVTRCECGLDCS